MELTWWWPWRQGAASVLRCAFEQPWLDTEKPRASGGGFPGGVVVTIKAPAVLLAGGVEGAPVTLDSL